MKTYMNRQGRVITLSDSKQHPRGFFDITSVQGSQVHEAIEFFHRYEGDEEEVRSHVLGDMRSDDCEAFFFNKSVQSPYLEYAKRGKDLIYADQSKFRSQGTVEFWSTSLSLMQRLMSLSCEYRKVVIEWRWDYRIGKRVACYSLTTRRPQFVIDTLERNGFYVDINLRSRIKRPKLAFTAVSDSLFG